MKVFWLALLFTVLFVGIAWAECWTTTIAGPNRVTVCTTCCWGNNCTTTCF